MHLYLRRRLGRFLSAGVVLIFGLTGQSSISHLAHAQNATDDAATESAATSAAIPQRPASKEQIEEWVAALNDGRYNVREEATRSLMEVGVPALEPLAAVASNGSPEASTRAITILESLYRLPFDPVDPRADRIELVLERLAASANHAVASRAGDALDCNDGLRETRALANIQRLGGVLRFEVDQNRTIPIAEARASRMSAVILAPEWTGGDEGLRFVKRLKRLRDLYHIPGDHVSEKAIRELQGIVPDLRVTVRGPSQLGIRARPEPGVTGMIWRIDQVEKGSAADLGGLQVGDVIVKFSGKAVPDFDALIELIKQSRPDQEIEVVVQRGEQEKTLKVVMQGWRNVEE